MPVTPKAREFRTRWQTGQFSTVEVKFLPPKPLVGFVGQVVHYILDYGCSHRTYVD
jgi:hypothetical protein